MKNLSLILFMLIFATGCIKNKPKIGEYKAVFEGTYDKENQTIIYNRSRNLSIIKTTSNEIHIAPCSSCAALTILEKDKNIANGVILMPGQGGTGGPSFPSQEIYINGVINKKNGKYIITGSHHWIYTDVDVINQVINHYTVTGTFEIKPI